MNPNFSSAITEGSFDSNVIIQIMEQLAQSSNPQQLRRLQTVIAASVNEFVTTYNDVKLEPRFFVEYYSGHCKLTNSDYTINS